MVKQNQEKSSENEFILTALILAFGIYCTTLFILLDSMLEWGYDILFNLFNTFILYLPAMYICWILKFTYDNKPRITKPQFRDTLWITVLIIVVLSLAQIGELYPICSHGVLSNKEILIAYANKAILHPLAFFFLIFVFNYFRMKILGKKMPLLYLVNILVLISLVFVISWGFYSKFLYLLKVLGIWSENGIKYKTAFIVLAAIFLFILKKRAKLLQFLKKLWNGIYKKIAKN